MKNRRGVDLERRRFLRAVGATALTYPFLRGVPSYAAAATEPPRYLILLFSPTGCGPAPVGCARHQAGLDDAHRHADPAGRRFRPSVRCRSNRSATR